MQTLLASLQNLLGYKRVLVGDAIVPYCTDRRKRYYGRALCLVRPNSADEIAAVIRLCAAAGFPIVPQGGNTGLVGGATPDADGRSVIINLQGMNAIRRIDVPNQTMTVEAGCLLQQVQQAAADAGQLFPLSMASEGSCTIGGNLATNAGGTQVLRYGNARELCLGLEVVTPQGEVWSDLRGLRKNNTGYDLRHLLIGSEGTLGIITAATLKLFPQPRSSSTAWATLPSVQAAVDLLDLARQQLDAALTGFELMGQFALQLVERYFPQWQMPLGNATPYQVLIEYADAHSDSHGRKQLEELLQAALEKGVIGDAVVAENIRQSRNLWQIRESIPLAQAESGLNIKHDIALPISALAQFVTETDAAVQQQFSGVRVVNFGHVGDGNLHYNVQAPEGQNPAEFLAVNEEAINRLVFDTVHRLGGTMSAEHGIGQLKRQILPRYQSPVALEMMRQIKRALDPQNIMNPGRLLP